MNRVKVESMEQFETLIDEGYTESIEDMARYLRISNTKARGLLKHAFRIELSESLYHEYKQGFNTKVPRIYYSEKEVLRYLISKNMIQVYYHDPRQSFTDKKVSRETQINNEYLLKDISMTKTLFIVSQSISNILIEESDYHFDFTEKRKGKLVDWYINRDSDIDLFDVSGKELYENILKTRNDVYTKSDYVKYTNMIKRGFYIRFQVGRSDNRYIHSVNQLKRSEQKRFIVEWIKNIASDKW